MDIALKAFEDVCRHYGLAKTAASGDEVREALMKWVGRPAAVGGTIGGTMGVFRGAKDIINDNEPDANPLLHPVAEGLRGGWRGAQLGVGLHALGQGAAYAGRKAGFDVPDLSQAARTAAGHWGRANGVRF
jgi:hypothetical protein